MTKEAMASDLRADAEMGQAARGNDRDAFAVLVKRYEVVVPALAYALTGSLAQSEEIAQETFLSAWSHLGDLRDPGRFRSWLYGIVRNFAKKFRRRRRTAP